jgi:glutathione peroxidase-family protein
MKKTMLYSFFILFLFSSESSIYDISVRAIDGDLINMSTLKNKKILITVIKAQNPDFKQLQYLQALQNVDTALKIITVPSLDFGGNGETGELASLKKSMALNFIILKPVFTRKNMGNNQHPLLKWLTSANENVHFDVDVKSVGQYFIINTKGELYSVLEKDVPANVLEEILHQ